MILLKGKQSMSVFWSFFYSTLSRKTGPVFKVAVRFHPGALFSKIPVFFRARKAVLCFLGLHSRPNLK